MYEEIFKNLEGQLSPDIIDELKKKQLHLGVFAEPYLTYMLEGKKTIESRFNKNRIVPYGKISKNDVVLVKKSSGPIVAYFTIKEVLFYDLMKSSIEEIKTKYGSKLCVGEDFWGKKKDSRYATIIIIDKLTKLTPFNINKKGMQTWILL
ncbi:MAG TPA: hypothetical protein DCY94_00160 [Firmicutes bacterium]|nr:hypothetical protein [Bacillota bacterium]